MWHLSIECCSVLTYRKLNTIRIYMHILTACEQKCCVKFPLWSMWTLIHVLICKWHMDICNLTFNLVCCPLRHSLVVCTYSLTSPVCMCVRIWFHGKQKIPALPVTRPTLFYGADPNIFFKHMGKPQKQIIQIN